MWCHFTGKWLSKGVGSEGVPSNSRWSPLTFITSLQGKDGGYLIGGHLTNAMGLYIHVRGDNLSLGRVVWGGVSHNSVKEGPLH